MTGTGPESTARAWEIETRSPVDTQEAAQRLAARLGPGDVLLLFGEMGAGKTCFVQGLAEGLGLDPRRVHSPSFIMVKRYGNGTGLNHVDLYRLEPGESFADLGLDDLFTSRDITAIEWAERLPDESLPLPRWEIRFEHAGDSRRRLSFRRLDRPTRGEAPTVGA